MRRALVESTTTTRKRLTPRQRYCLTWMTRGAVIACGYDRAWTLMLRNDPVCPVTVGLLRGMKEAGLIEPDHGSPCWVISAAGRAALEPQP